MKPAHIRQIVWLCLWETFWFAVLSYLVMFVVPSAERYYTDFELEIPRLASMVLEFSRAYRTYWYGAAAFWLANMAACVTLCQVGRSRAATWINRVWSVAVFALLLFVIVGGAIAMFSFYNALQHELT